MFERILAAIDQSDAAGRVIAAAREMAELSHGEVWVLHLREREVMGRGGGMYSAESHADAGTLVDTATGKLAAAGVTAHSVVRDTLFGHAAGEIVDEARAHDAGVIVMGSRGHGDLAGLVVGSTAHKVIHLSDRPVLVVR